jgi:hypothetical protein
MKVDVSAKQISIPRQCACCSGSPSMELQASASKKRGKTQFTNSWAFPYCSQCAAHVGRYNAAFAVLGGGIAVGALGMLFYSSWCALIGIVGVGGWLFLMNSAHAMRGAACACTGAAVSYMGWHGTLHSFHFVSHSYATQFMHANRNKLVNLTQAQHQLLGGSSAGMATPSRRIRRT